MAKKSKSLGIALLLGLIVVAVIALPSLTNLFKTTVNASDIGGGVGLGFIIHYADGTSQVISQTPNTFSILPLIITDSTGRQINEIDALIIATLNTYSTVQSWSTATTQHMEVYKVGDTVPKTSSTASFSTSGSSWQTGTQKTLFTTPLGWQAIETAIQPYGSGVWNLQLNATLNMDVGVTSGEHYQATARTASAQIQFTYLNGVQSFTATMSTTPLYQIYNP